jgi:hypothetical protein
LSELTEQWWAYRIARNRAYLALARHGCQHERAVALLDALEKRMGIDPYTFSASEQRQEAPKHMISLSVRLRQQEEAPTT